MEKNKLSQEQINEIKARNKNGETQSSLAKEYGVSKSAIYYHCNLFAKMLHTYNERERYRRNHDR